MQKASWSQTSVTVDLVLKTSFCKEDAFPVLHVEQIKVLMKSNKEVRLNDTGDWRKLTQKLWSLHRCLSHAEVWDYDYRLSLPQVCYIPSLWTWRVSLEAKGDPGSHRSSHWLSKTPPCMTDSQGPSIFLWQLQNSGWWTALILWLDLLCPSVLLLG